MSILDGPYRREGLPVGRAGAIAIGATEGYKWTVDGLKKLANMSENQANQTIAVVSTTGAIIAANIKDKGLFRDVSYDILLGLSMSAISRLMEINKFTTKDLIDWLEDKLTDLENNTDSSGQNPNNPEYPSNPNNPGQNPNNPDDPNNPGGTPNTPGGTGGAGGTGGTGGSTGGKDPLNPFGGGGDWGDAGAGCRFGKAGSAKWDPLVLDLDGNGMEALYK